MCNPNGDFEMKISNTKEIKGKKYMPIEALDPIKFYKVVRPTGIDRPLPSQFHDFSHEIKINYDLLERVKIFVRLFQFEIAFPNSPKMKGLPAHRTVVILQSVVQVPDNLDWEDGNLESHEKFTDITEIWDMLNGDDYNDDLLADARFTICDDDDVITYSDLGN
jgi:hypothetical protein